MSPNIVRIAIFGTIESGWGRFFRAPSWSQRSAWKREGKRVVFTNGCYDLLHPVTSACSKARARSATC